MTKTWETKRRIFYLLSSGNKTLSEISAILKLAPSTVSQHLRELQAMNAIDRFENPHIRKWKYYRANPEFGAIIENRPVPMNALMRYAMEHRFRKEVEPITSNFW